MELFFQTKYICVRHAKEIKKKMNQGEMEVYRLRVVSWCSVIWS